MKLSRSFVPTVVLIAIAISVAQTGSQPPAPALPPTQAPGAFGTGPAPVGAGSAPSNSRRGRKSGGEPILIPPIKGAGPFGVDGIPEELAPTSGDALSKPQNALKINGSHIEQFRNFDVSGGSQQAYTSDNYLGSQNRSSNTSMFFNGELPYLRNWFLDGSIFRSQGFGATTTRWRLKYDTDPLKFAVGDLSVNFEGSEFTSFSKSLQGLALDMKLLKTGSMSFMFTQTKAAPFNDRLQGNNTAGPYPLQNSPIVDGSETVLVDEQPKSRGRDYTIDYTQGLITFVDGTRSQPLPVIIPNTSTISVSYEYNAPGQTAGNFYGTRINLPLPGKLGDKFKLGTTFLTQQSTGGLATQRTQQQIREEFSGNNTIGPFALTFRPILSGSELVTAGTTPQVRARDYQIDYTTGTLTFLRPVPAGINIAIEYVHSAQNGGVGGDRTLLGFDGSVQLFSNWATTFEYASSSGGQSLSGAQSGGAAKGFRTAGTLGKLANVTFGYRDVEPGFQHIESTGFARNEKGFDTTVQLGGAGGKLGLNLQFSQNQSSSGLQFGLANVTGANTTTGATAVNSLNVRTQQLSSQMQFRWRENRDLQLSIQRMSNSQAGSDSLFTASTLGLNYPIGRLQMTSNLNLTSQDFGGAGAAGGAAIGGTSTRTGRMSVNYDGGSAKSAAPPYTVALNLNHSASTGSSVGSKSNGFDTVATWVPFWMRPASPNRGKDQTAPPVEAPEQPKQPRMTLTMSHSRVASTGGSASGSGIAGGFGGGYFGSIGNAYGGGYGGGGYGGGGFGGGGYGSGLGNSGVQGTFGATGSFNQGGGAFGSGLGGYGASPYGAYPGQPGLPPGAPGALPGQLPLSALEVPPTIAPGLFGTTGPGFVSPGAFETPPSATLGGRTSPVGPAKPVDPSAPPTSTPGAFGTGDSGGVAPPRRGDEEEEIVISSATGFNARLKSDRDYRRRFLFSDSGLPMGFYGRRFITSSNLSPVDLQARMARLEQLRLRALGQVVGNPGQQLGGPGVVTGSSNVNSVFTSMRADFTATHRINVGLNFDTSNSKGTGFVGNSQNDQIVLDTRYRATDWLNFFAQTASQRVLFLDQNNGTASNWFNLGMQIGNPQGINGTLSFQRIDTLSTVPVTVGAAQTSATSRNTSHLTGMDARMAYPIMKNVNLVGSYRISGSTGGGQPTVDRNEYGMGLEIGLLRNLRGGLTMSRLSARSPEANSRYRTSLLESEIRLEF